VGVGTIGQAVGLFAVTNVDDIVVLALFFAQGTGRPGAVRAIAIGQYLGFALIMAVAVAAGFGATFLPADAIPYLGLLPLALGITAALQARHVDLSTFPPAAGRTPRDRDGSGPVGPPPPARRPDRPRGSDLVEGGAFGL
jgi:hypothetical protein